MNYQYTDVLNRSGLAEKESRVYEELLRSGQIGIGSLLGKVPYKRGDLYNILYSLRDKGLIQQNEIRGRIHFKPNDPNQILRYVSDQAVKFQQAENLMQSAMPYLSDLYRMTTDRPIVRVYDGFEGIKAMYEDTLVTGQPIDAFLTLSDANPQVHEWLRKNYAKRRVQAGITARVIVSTESQDMANREYVAKDAAELRETRIVDKQYFPCELEIQIYGSKVSYTNYNKADVLVGVIVDNDFIASSMRGMFALSWAYAEAQKQASEHNQSSV
jgi:sugar-specific transcriptional regulator TrmB